MEIERVEVRSVVKTFGSTAALRGIDVDINPGALTLIEGANGSGKSTLLRIIGTVMKPTQGHVSYPPLGKDQNEVRRQLGWLSHESLCYGELSGRANVELVAELRGEAIGDWEAVADRFQLGAFAKRPVNTMSRGQRQRVALARALVHNPSLVLLDEPSTGLDTAGIQRLRTAITAEVERGAIVVVVTHEAELFRDLPQSRVTLNRGRLAA